MSKEGSRRNWGNEGRCLFTKRETEIAQLLVDGVESPNDISSILGITSITAGKYKENLVERLREHGIEPASLKRAIAESIWRGLVDISHLPPQTVAGLTDIEANFAAFITTGYDTNYICEELHLTKASWRILKGSLLKKLRVKNLNQVAVVTAIEMMKARPAGSPHV